MRPIKTRLTWITDSLSETCYRRNIWSPPAEYCRNTVALVLDSQMCSGYACGFRGGHRKVFESNSKLPTVASPEDAPEESDAVPPVVPLVRRTSQVYDICSSVLPA